MKTIILSGLLFSQVLCAEEIPTLHFDDRVTWKQVFDDGFRPKHLKGLERNTCVTLDQAFWVKFMGREAEFKVEKGRVSFTFLYDDFLSMIWHQGSDAITLEEGRRGVDEFRKVFDGFIIREITMPPLIDPSGLVEAGNDENNIKARVGEYLIWYGFDNSMRKVKPIIPHFYIAWIFPGMPDKRSKDPGDVVRPPKGYEWYSLDPKVNTPDPGATPDSEPDSKTEKPAIEKRQIPEEPRKVTPPITPQATHEETSWGRWAGLLALLIVVGITLFRKFSLRNSGPT